ncbi:hypothetical protein [Hufsiella ginkgonis]|uniref:Uncharacterized protein n=1 Tax=Hufsiella ginkgonis TaxID=2695274 RepID=A0A7K1Y3Q4_9SPHI|nr:hypothetical protein [Hufsiella ginkgonis]MXV17748.1 hypothetical protein [Hufsiella ginkgonis]
MNDDHKTGAERVDEELKASQPVETDYEAHHDDPAPPKEAVVEQDEDGAGKAMKWVIPVVVAVLFILWLIIK